MGKEYDVTQTIDVYVGRETCWEVLLDFENYPSWHKYVRTAKIVERYDNGDAKLVHNVFDIFLKQKFEFTLEYEYDKKNYRISTRTVSGNFQDSKSNWHFKKVSEDTTGVEFNIQGDFGVVIPDKILFFLVEKVMKGLLDIFKAEVERKEKEA